MVLWPPVVPAVRRGKNGRAERQITQFLGKAMTPEPDVILFETSPYGNVDAIVQHDGRVVYFYLNGHAVDNQQPFGTRAVWVRNLVEGPYVLNEDEARSGQPPLLPRTHCVHPKPQLLPEADNLRVVWLEEGNGAALVEQFAEAEASRILAVIPPWSGLEGFHGYAADCAAEGPLAWPLPDNPKLQQRIEAADEFWQACQSSQHPFTKLHSQVLDAWRQSFADTSEFEESCFSIDGGKFPPRGLVQFFDKSTGSMTIATVGLAMCPQPAVELFVDQPSDYRRIELAIRLDKELAADLKIVEAVSRQVSTLATHPWRNFTWLGPGHTCGLANSIPGRELALLVHDQQHDKNSGSGSVVQLGSFRDDPVNLLWLVPISEDQRARLEAGQIAVN